MDQYLVVRKLKKTLDLVENHQANRFVKKINEDYRMDMVLDDIDLNRYDI
jgi:hypothetical protein